MRPLRTAFALVAAALLACAAIAAQVTLTWTDNSTNEAGFRVERSTDGETFAEIASIPAVPGTGGLGGYVDATLADGTTYHYRVRAWNAAGYSAYSNTAQWTTLPALPDGAPGGLDAVGDPPVVTLNSDLQVNGNLVVTGTITQQGGAQASAAPPAATPAVTLASVAH